MSNQTAYQVKLALVNAQVALQQNNKMEARRWATIAAQLAPENEESWLILAGISSPSASVAYLQRALQVNPKSERAIKGMQWALARLSNVQNRSTLVGTPPTKETTQPVKLVQEPSEKISRVIETVEHVHQEPEPKDEFLDEIRIDESLKQTAVKPVRVKENKLRKSGSGFSWGVTTILLLVILSTAVVVWAALPGWTALARSSAAPIPGDVLYKPSLTPTLTATATVTPTPTPTETPTPTATFTPLPTNTPWPTNTPLPLPTAAPTKKAPTKPVVDTSGHWIDIDLSEQRLYAYDGNSMISSFLVSTGTSAHPTVVGEFAVYVKYRYTDMSGPGYYLPDVPYTMYFYSGYGIHGTYWHDNFGTPMSHGCVNMRTSDAEWVYNFSNVGTPVIVHN